MKIIDKDQPYYFGLFENYNLTELMVLSKNGRRISSNKNLALRVLLDEKLRGYGLCLFGEYERMGLVFRGISMMDNFPIENEPILKQLYGYVNFIAHIGLRGFDEFACAFDYYVESGKCELQKHRYGTIISKIKFESLKQMLDYIKENGYYSF